MQAVAGAMADDSQLRIERFKAPDIVPGPELDQTSFDVICQSTGQRIAVGPDVSVLEASTMPASTFPAHAQRASAEPVKPESSTGTLSTVISCFPPRPNGPRTNQCLFASHVVGPGT